MTKRKIRNKKNTLPKIGKKTVHSPFEYEVYKLIKHELPRGATVEFEAEKLSYIIESEYTPDFVITKKDGTKIYIEAKGNGHQFDETVRRKMLAVKRAHPDLDIRIVFHNDGKVGRTRKDGTYMRQSDWAKRHGFPFAIRTIPKDWFKE